MYFKRFFKIMAFAMAFPWVLYSCDNNSPDIYDGARVQQSGFSSYSGGSGTDMELEDGTAVLYADALTLTFPDGSKKIFRSVYFGLSGGLWTSHNNFEYVAPPAPDYSKMTAQQLVDGGYFKVPYNLCRDFAPMGRRYVGLASTNGYLLDVWYFSQVAFYSDEFAYLFNLSDVYIAFIRDGSWVLPWENNVDNRHYRFFSTK